MNNTNKNFFIGCIFILYIGTLFSSNPLQENQNPLAKWFPIEKAYKNVRLCSTQYNDQLLKRTEQLLKDTQWRTYGFCLRGIVEDDDEDPRIAVVTPQPGTALSFEIYSFSSERFGILIGSIAMDPTFKDGMLLKKTTTKDLTGFWFTRFYRTKINNILIQPSCSFWGPFFEKPTKVCCLFFTSLKNYKNNKTLRNNRFNMDYPPYTIFYYNLFIHGYAYYVPCYIAYSPLKESLLKGKTSKYFALVLAIFFPYKDTNAKKIFLTYYYTIEQLQALQNYLNGMRNSDHSINPPATIYQYITNQNLYSLLMYFLRTTKNLPTNNSFYKQINNKMNYLIRNYNPAFVPFYY
ncbi:hypothetical protein EKK58_02785 [Candidatus Dependentiae bacterium]|nr:MAG: hypothetical protein EKK58_02785 [Candidatus Dependentiae bacterium]